MSISNLELEEMNFNNFLNKIIVLSSKNYYRKESLRNKTELKLLNDDTYYDYFIDSLKYDDIEYNFDNINQFIENCDNEHLSFALKKLSTIELTVIFGLFVKQLKNNDLSDLLKISSNSISKIKIRALKKIKKYLKGCDYSEY